MTKFNLYNDFSLKFTPLLINNHKQKKRSFNPYNNPKIDNINFIVSNNNLINNPNLLIPLINKSQSITGQYPSLIKANKSIASFKLRKNMVTGLQTTLRNKKANNLLKILRYSLFPRYGIKLSSTKFGLDNLNIFSHITPSPSINQNDENLSKAGGYIQLNIKLPKMKLVNNKEILPTKFYLSMLNFPLKSLNSTVGSAFVL